MTSENENISAEQAADFAKLNNEAAEEVQELAPGETPPQDLGVELAGLFTVAVTTLKPMLPSLGEIYTPDTIKTAAGAIAAVCNKHGWLSGGMFGEYGKEIAAAFVLVPLAIATNQGIKNDIARAKERTVKTLPGNTTAAQVNQAGQDQKTVIIGSAADQAAAGEVLQ